MGATADQSYVAIPADDGELGNHTDADYIWACDNDADEYGISEEKCGQI